MIDSSVLTSFKAYLQDISGENVMIGDEDIGANAYPCWTVTLEEDMKFTFLNVKSLSALINVKCNLYVDRTKSEQALQIIFKTMLKINQFDENSGSGLGSEEKEQGESSDIKTEIIDGMIKLSFPYRLKTIILDS